ncbi:hypothetical protein DXV76_03010 [Rhodobacteraceae bacterium CCMM004]|nr:hypothetical protein DXV76_03010 [Rhodobacteraceae bacterium CCMM004]
MATVSNVRLDIDEVDRRRSRVTVRYRICYSSCEAMANTVFRERVTLRGDDPVWDDHLLTLRSSCVKATQGCVERSVSAVVATSSLDEDADTIVLGWVWGNKDEVYARVELDPFEPRRSQGDSGNIVAHFGPARN